MTKLKKKRLLLVAVLLIVIGGVGSQAYLKKELTADETNTGIVQSHRSYGIRFDAGTSYATLEVPQLSFRIEDEKGKTLKSFDEIHGNKVHTVAIRKDRADIIYLEPTYAEDTGTFTIKDAQFPSDGEYRLFMEFTPSDAQIGPEGTSKLTVTAYQDIRVGNQANYQPQDIGNEQFKSKAYEFDLNLFLAPHDPSDPGLAAGSSSSFAVSVYKNAQQYTQLENYQESRGSMMLFGPGLEFLHIHSPQSELPDSFVLSFSAVFPVAGKYKAYLQTKADGRIHTTDYVLAVASAPESISPEDLPGPMSH